MRATITTPAKMRLLAAAAAVVPLMAACGPGTNADPPGAIEEDALTIDAAAKSAVEAFAAAYAAEVGRTRPVAIHFGMVEEIADERLAQALMRLAASYPAAADVYPGDGVPDGPVEELHWELWVTAPGGPDHSDNELIAHFSDWECVHYSPLYSVEVVETADGWTVGEVVDAGNSWSFVDPEFRARTEAAIPQRKPCPD